MSEIETADRKITPFNKSESHKINISLPQIKGYIWGWIRFAIGGYKNNISPEKDNKHLNEAISKGWMPVVKSPHPDLPLNKSGYVTAGDLVLCMKQIDDRVEICEYLISENTAIGIEQNTQ